MAKVVTWVLMLVWVQHIEHLPAINPEERVLATKMAAKAADHMVSLHWRFRPARVIFSAKQLVGCFGAWKPLD
jgi:hypothetical protein